MLIDLKLVIALILEGFDVIADIINFFMTILPSRVPTLEEQNFRTIYGILLLFSVIASILRLILVFYGKKLNKSDENKSSSFFRIVSTLFPCFVGFSNSTEELFDKAGGFLLVLLEDLPFAILNAYFIGESSTRTGGVDGDLFGHYDSLLIISTIFSLFMIGFKSNLIFNFDRDYITWMILFQPIVFLIVARSDYNNGVSFNYGCSHVEPSLLPDCLSESNAYGDFLIYPTIGSILLIANIIIPYIFDLVNRGCNVEKFLDEAYPDSEISEFHCLCSSTRIVSKDFYWCSTEAFKALKTPRSTRSWFLYFSTPFPIRLIRGLVSLGIFCYNCYVTSIFPIYTAQFIVLNSAMLVFLWWIMVLIASFHFFVVDSGIPAYMYRRDHLKQKVEDIEL